MLLFLVGANRAGKTRQAGLLRDRLPGVAVLDLDEPFEEGAPPPELDRVWRAQQTEGWIRRAVEHQREGVDSVLAGGVFGEVLACPSAAELDGIAGCLLDCEENERARRLRTREPGCIAADDLWPHVSWSAWLRIHRVDPQIFRAPLRDDNGAAVAPSLRWERWENWCRGDPRWRFGRVDTTADGPERTADALAAWIEAERALHRDGFLRLSGRWWD